MLHKIFFNQCRKLTIIRFFLLSTSFCDTNCSYVCYLFIVNHLSIDKRIRSVTMILLYLVGFRLSHSCFIYSRLTSEFAHFCSYTVIELTAKVVLNIRMVLAYNRRCVETFNFDPMSHALVHKLVQTFHSKRDIVARC